MPDIREVTGAERVRKIRGVTLDGRVPTPFAAKVPDREDGSPGSPRRFGEGTKDDGNVVEAKRVPRDAVGSMSARKEIWPYPLTPRAAFAHMIILPAYERGSKKIRVGWDRLRAVGGWDGMKQESHLGVYAMIIHQNRIALILKSRGPYTGMWDLPGGKIEFGESPVQALTREVREEVDLHILTATLVDTLSICVSYETENGESIELHHLGVVYKVEADTPEKLRTTGDDQDADQAGWFPLSKALNLQLTPFARTLLTANA